MTLEEKFIKACENGNLNKVNKYLKKTLLNVHSDDERAFRYSCYYGRINVVEKLLSLTSHRKININASNEWAIFWACKNGHLDVVEKLLSDKRMSNDYLAYAKKELSYANYSKIIDYVSNHTTIFNFVPIKNLDHFKQEMIHSANPCRLIETYQNKLMIEDSFDKNKTNKQDSVDNSVFAI